MQPPPNDVPERKFRWSSALRTPPDGRMVLALFASANLVYLFMLTVTIPQVEHFSGGLKPFDVMPTGYGTDYAQTFLSNLGEDGRHYYLTRQLALDMIYPALYALGGAAVWFWLLGQVENHRSCLRWIGALPLISGAADYVENGLIMSLLTRFPDLSNGVVRLSSRVTLFKSGAMMVFILLLVLLLLLISLRALSRRFQAQFRIGENSADDPAELS